MIIEIEIKNKIATLKSINYVVTHNNDYVARFIFDDEWSNIQSKTARFIWDNGYTDVIFTGNDCNIPRILATKKLEIGVFAGSLKTSTPVVIKTNESILFKSGTPIAPTPSVYEQIMEELDNKFDNPSNTGTVGQVLKKTENGSRWENESGGGGSGTTNHAALNNLEYENSGHTGFQKEITSGNKLSADLVLENTNKKFVSDNEKLTWNNKGSYSKPDGGIPKNDLSNSIQTSLDKADSALQDEDLDALEAEVQEISDKIPTQATSENQLADKSFVNSSINSVTAYYITKNANGDPFATKSELTNATTFYSGGVERIPTRNDYCLVLADETKIDAITGEHPTTRYIHQNNQWEFQFIVNKTTLTAAQLAAINSGITALLVLQIAENTNARHSHDNKSVLDGISSNDISNWNEKQAAISDLETIRSGATLGATSVQDDNYVHTDNNFTDSEKQKLAGIDLSTKENVFRFSTMPTASLANVGNIVQFIGTTDSTYTNGYFYKCTLNVDIYEWQQVNVQPSSSSYADLTNKPQINSVELSGNKSLSDLGIASSIIISKVTETSSVVLTLSPNTSHRLLYSTGMTSIDFSMPSTYPEDFECELIFNTVNVGTEFYFNYNQYEFVWSGDDITDGLFVPVQGKTYNIIFWYDGINVNAVTRGVL